MAAVKDKAGPDTYEATDGRDVFVFNARDPGFNRIEGLDPNEDMVVIAGARARGVEFTQTALPEIIWSGVYESDNGEGRVQRSSSPERRPTRTG